MNRFGMFLVLTLAVLMILPACAKKDTTPVADMEPAEEIAPPPPPPVIEEVEEVIVEEVEPIMLEDIFFEYDKFSIKAEYKATLTMNAEALMEYADVVLVIEGHCDERGTNEYNLSLGEKRAKAVLDFYVAYGIDAKRLSIVSYGEERPFDSGHNESAWSMNRRAHMAVK
ncbi:MAG: peptidoglycan-associated lipoprotein Pal [Candidatus Krumholzibacteriota bacterium]|nr:peptidoglycan-associated lipoprotein Pal [Candidatus Krumholzibacteriota bacterium]